MSTNYSYEGCASEPLLCRIYHAVEVSSMGDKTIEECHYDATSTDLTVTFTNALDAGDEAILDQIVSDSLGASVCEPCAKAGIEKLDTGWINRSDWTNVHLGSLEVDYDNLSGVFCIGETITGGTSGTTGIVMSNDGSTLILRNVAEAAGGDGFDNNEEITGSITGATADVNEASGNTKDQDSNVYHGFSKNLSDLLVRVLISTDGTDNNSFEIIYAVNEASAGQVGMTIYQIDTNNIKVQTGTTGIRFFADDGTCTAILDNEDYYYKIIIKPI